MVINAQVVNMAKVGEFLSLITTTVMVPVLSLIKPEPYIIPFHPLLPSFRGHVQLLFSSIMYIWALV